jgi:hypothetical protein
VIPIASPIIAVAALIITIMIESKRIRTNQDKNLFLATAALYRDLDWAWQQYKVRAGELQLNQPSPPARVREIKAAWDRVFQRIFTDPATLEGFYQQYLANTKGNLMLLLSEVKVRLDKVGDDGNGLEDHLLLLALHNLLWLCEKDKTKLAEHRQVMDLIVNQNPELFENLKVERP